MYGIQVSKFGGPEVLEHVELPDPTPNEGQALVRVDAAGVNFIDVYQRIGLYALPLPLVPGSEGAGVVEAVGAGVTDVKPGDRVAWAIGPGSYAEKVCVAADKLVLVPDAIDTRTAAAAMLQGMTAHYLVTSTHVLKPGQTALVHAAAGGVGGLLVQMAKARGARVIATASTTKLDLVRSYGADVVIDYTTADFEAEVNRVTDGRGVEVVYDSVGKTTFDKSLECVALRGTLVLYGQSSGVVAPFAPARLGKRGVFLTRPGLGHYTATRDELSWRAREVLESIASGALRLRIDRALPLRDAGEAHRLLEGRHTTGKLLLVTSATT
jgi:NADPH:quinone reductase